MLLEFSFKNFKSYRDRATLDLSAASRLSKAFHVQKVGTERVLPCAVIFGANAGGKSNVYDAFATMRYYVLNSFAFGGKDSQQTIRKPAREFFLFDDKARSEPTEFEVYFVESEKDEAKASTWQYGFLFDDTRVLKEWLFLRKGGKNSEFIPVILREDDIIKSEIFKELEIESIKKSLNLDTLALSLGEKLKFSECEKVADLFRSFRMANYGKPYEALIRSEEVPIYLVSNEEAQNDVAKFLATFDRSITGFKIEETPLAGIPGGKRFTAFTSHRRDPRKTLPLARESSGTQKMFSLYPEIKRALETGGGLFIDELGARLHPLLHMNILASFLDPTINKNGAQLIFTSHDVALMAFDYLRDDEIWIAEKNVEEESSLYSFSEFKDSAKMRGKKGRALFRNYLVGKLGGTPILDSIEF